VAKDKITRVQLEAGGFLSDPDFVAMDAEQRGVYCSLIFYLYANGGSIKSDANGTAIALLCGCYKTGNDWLNVWEKVGKKFLYRRGRLFHKRVSTELARARKFMQDKQRAGIKGAESRWHSHNGANGTPIATKRSVNVSEEKNITYTKDPAHSPSTATLRFAFDNALRKTLPPLDQSDRTAYHNVGLWLDEQIAVGRFEDGIFEQVLTYAQKAATNKKNRNPRAVFTATLQRELGYRNGAK